MSDRPIIHYKTVSSPWQVIFAIPTSIIGYAIHGSLFWAIVDFLFWPIA